MTREARGSNEM